MRIIGGQKKGLKLSAINGDWIRPTSDKIRGAIFSSLFSRFGTNGKVFVDCFAGSGAMAIEALSRGFENVYMFDNNRKSIAVIKKNLGSAGYLQKAHVFAVSAQRGLEELENKHLKADVYFMDPPYKKIEQVYELIEYIGQKDIITHDGIIVIEHDKNDIMKQVIGNFILIKEKKYGNTVISYYEDQTDE